MSRAKNAIKDFTKKGGVIETDKPDQTPTFIFAVGVVMMAATPVIHAYQTSEARTQQAIGNNVATELSCVYQADDQSASILYGADGVTPIEIVMPGDGSLTQLVKDGSSCHIVSVQGSAAEAFTFSDGSSLSLENVSDADYQAFLFDKAVGQGISSEAGYGDVFASLMSLKRNPESAVWMNMHAMSELNNDSTAFQNVKYALVDFAADGIELSSLSVQEIGVMSHHVVKGEYHNWAMQNHAM